MAPAKKAKWIRNLRGVPVHLRLYGEGRTDPYRIQLNRRGLPGDIHQVPANLTDDGTFVAGIDVLFEVITESEARSIQYNVATGYQGAPVVVERPQDTVVSVVPDVDSKGKLIGPRVVRKPGSDRQYEDLAEGNQALPKDAFKAATKIERVTNS